MKKQLAIIGAVAAISAAGLTGATIANAATTTSVTNPMSSLVDAIASKFNLNKSDVQSVFDAQRTQMDADREAELKTEVAALVTSGKLTQAQADAINAKRAELDKQRQTDMAAGQSKTDTERKADMDAHKTALDTWMKEQGIDTQYSYLLMGGRGHGGPGGPGGMRGERGGDTTTTSTTAQ
jgi:polyhydroxyalkanoate synthesis regulator phasin